MFAEVQITAHRDKPLNLPSLYDDIGFYENERNSTYIFPMYIRNAVTLYRIGDIKQAKYKNSIFVHFPLDLNNE